jgi:hypothetical protein
MNRRPTAFLLAIAILAVLMYLHDPADRPALVSVPSQPPTSRPAATSPSGQSPPADVELPVVDDVVADPSRELLDALLRVPVSEWHGKRVKNMGRESVRELVENLANFDDMHLATTADGYDHANGTYDNATHLLAHLFRVRRLLAVEKESPGLVAPIMTDAYAKAMQAWPEAYRDWSTRFYSPLDSALSVEEPLEVDKVTTRAITATYLLGESADAGMLGILMDGYGTQQKWLGEYKRAARAQCPVPPVFTLYAIHRLVTTIPDASISAEARAARDVYVSWAKQRIPEPREVMVPAWNSKYDESHVLLRVGDPRQVLLEQEPKIVMNVYPDGFKEGSRFEADSRPELSSEEQEWQDQLLAAARSMIPS